MRHFLRDPIECAVIARAEAQWGILRRTDLAAVGLGAAAIRHRCRNGRLHELHPGVYTLGHRVLPRRAEFLAAVWWVGGDATLGDESACAFKRWTYEDDERPGPVHVVTTKTRRSRPGVIVHQTRCLPADDVLTYERLLRVTDDARTLIDRADRCTFRELRGLADQLRRLPVAQLEAKQARLPGRSGRARIQRLITAQDARARFDLERRFTAYLEQHGLPQPDGRNEVVVPGLETDAVYHGPRLALELDSRAHHARQAEMAEDKRRDRRYRRAGWTPIRVMWEELDPADRAVAVELAEELGLAPLSRRRA